MKLNRALLLASAALFPLACDDSSSSAPVKPQGTAAPTAITLGTYTSKLHGGKLSATVATSKNAEVGWNEFEVTIKDPRFKDSTITDVHLKPLPWMKMSSMEHSAPFELLGASPTNPKAFRFANVFTMPSGAMGTWEIRLRVHDHRYSHTADSAKETDTIVIPVEVKEPTRARLFKFTPADGIVRIVSLREPMKPVSGVNALEFVVHRKKDMMSFPADSGFTLAFDPTMPDMGHGSDGNIQPVHSGKGHYKGKVNFTMSGYWKLSIGIQDSTKAEIHKNSFDVDVTKP